MSDASSGLAARLRLVAVPGAAALAAALYLARLAAESRPVARSWPQVAGLLAGGLAVAAVGVLLLRRARYRAWPLILLGAYALWPWADPRLALAVGAVALAALLLAQRRPAAPGWLCDLLAGGGALALYAGTLAPSVQPADAGEFQLVAAVLGIAHPPGYPLYTLLGRAFTLLPLGDPAWRVNLFAAVCAAATLAVLCRAARRATGSAAAGLLGALALGLVPTYWAQGTFANIRSLTALLEVLSLHWLLRYGETRSPRHLLALGVTFGLGVTHHSSLALLGLPFLAYLAAVDPWLFLQPRRWLRPLAGFAGCLLVFAYLPLRSAMNPSFDTPSVRTLGGLVSHVLALGFQGDMLYYLGKPTLGLRLAILGDILNLEFGPALWLAALALGLLAARRRWPWALLWGGVALVNTFAAVTYRAPQTVEYLLPTYVALALGLGLGLGALFTDWALLLPSSIGSLVAGHSFPPPHERGGGGEHLPSPRGRGDGGEGLPFAADPGVHGRCLARGLAALRRGAKAAALRGPSPAGAGLAGAAARGWASTGQHVGEGLGVRALLGGLVAWLALGNGLAAYPSFQALHRDNSARQEAVQLLQAAAPGALILSNWHQATPLWYLQQAEGVRRDVTVTYVYPEGATPNGEVWARRIRQAVGRRQVLVTNRYPEYAGLPYRFVPLGQAWLVEAGPGAAELAGLSGERQLLGDKIEFLGAHLATGEGEPGEEVAVEVAWRPRTALERDYSWFVHLAGPRGIAGQADLTYGAGRVPAGQATRDVYRFTLRPDTPPGEYRLIAGVYITFADGRWERLRTAAGSDAITLGTVRVRPRRDPPATAGPLQVFFAGGSRLVGVDYDDSIAGQRRVYLHWYHPAGAPDLDLALRRAGQLLAQVRVAGGSDAGYQTVSCAVSPGPGAITLEAAAGGQAVPLLGAWHRPVRGLLALPGRADGARYLDLGGEMVLVGARWQPPAPVAGAPLRAELEFIAQRALTHDYSVSLSLEGQGWRVQNDGTPALGAIPTLKWLAGWPVRDPRALKVPREAAGPASLRLTVYDAFALSPLAVGDDRLAKAGQGVQASLWEGVLP